MTPAIDVPIDPRAMDVRADEAAAVLKTLANAQRLRILCQLVHEERTVGQINEQLPGLSQSALSQHLARLREEGIVGTRRESTQVWYRLVDEPSRQLLGTLYAIYCSPAKPRRQGGARPDGRSR